MVELIRPLYDIERALRESKAPPEEVKQKRKDQSRLIVEEFFKELIKRHQDTQNPPRNKLKDAIDYALTRQPQLSSWLQNPYLPIDNNQVERAIRPITVERKNSLFIGSPDAGQRAAIIYTMVEECKRTGIGFQQWLAEVLRRLPTLRASDGYLSPYAWCTQSLSREDRQQEGSFLSTRQRVFSPRLQGFCLNAYIYNYPKNVQFVSYTIRYPRNL